MGARISARVVKGPAVLDSFVVQLGMFARKRSASERVILCVLLVFVLGALLIGALRFVRSGESVKAGQKRESSRVETTRDVQVPHAESVAKFEASNVEVDDIDQARTQKIRFQSYEDSLKSDLMAVSDSLALDPGLVRESRRFQVKFANLVEKLRSVRPQRIAGAWLEPLPAIRGNIRIVGQLDRATRRSIEESKLNASAVVVHEGAAFSEDEQSLREGYVLDVIRETKVPLVMLSTDQKTGAIRVQLNRDRANDEDIDLLWRKISALTKTASASDPLRRIWTFQRGSDLVVTLVEHEGFQ